MMVVACGKKGDPVPTKVVPPGQVSGLRAAWIGEGIVISWPVPADGKGRPEVWKILRHDEPQATECPGCPRDFSPLAEVRRGDPRYAGDEGEMRFTDGGVREGRVYRYRIVACTAGGICSGPTETAGMRKPGP
jgi:hypothetical protein